MSISRLGRNLSIYRLADLFLNHFQKQYLVVIQLLSICNYNMTTDVLLLWEKSIAREIIARGFLFQYYCKENLLCRNWKILYEMILLSRHFRLQRMSVLGMSVQVPQSTYVIQLIQIYINLMILWWSKLRALKSTLASRLQSGSCRL